MRLSPGCWIWSTLLLAAAAPPLVFSRQDGSLTSVFLRDKDVAAQVEARSGAQPRIVVGFPAGNSGAGLWLAADGADTVLTLGAEPVPVREADGERGVAVTVATGAPKLTLVRAVLGSLRFLRDYDGLGQLPQGYEQRLTLQGGQVRLRRTSFDGRHHFEVRIDPAPGTTAEASADGHGFNLAQTKAGGVRFRLTALSDETPLTPVTAPLGQGALPTPQARRAAEALEFLTYREKLLAGSWRYLTYFGRDSLLSLAMLLPALEPDVAEAGLGAALARLGPDGEVAHEEELGDFAAYHHLQDKDPPGKLGEPELDYKMVDEDFLLLPAVARFAELAGTARLDAFLARATPGGESHRQLLRKNLALVLAKARPLPPRRPPGRSSG